MRNREWNECFLRDGDEPDRGRRAFGGVEGSRQDGAVFLAWNDVRMGSACERLGIVALENPVPEVAP